MQRVWNTTDDTARPEVSSRVMMVMGTNVKPGRFVKVDDAQLAHAHKVKKDAAAGLLYIGAEPPYMVARRKTRVKLPKDVGRAHGQVSAAPALEEAKVKVDAVDQVKTEEVVETKAEEPVTEEEKTEESSNESGSRKSKRNRR